MVAYTDQLTLEMSVTDMDKAIDWWQNTMGLTLAYRADEMGWAEIQLPTPGVTVGLNANGTGAGAGGATIVLGVRDIDAARAELEGKGVTFPKAIEEIPGMVKLAEFEDPFGNRLTLAQSLMG
jgi:predicted enzyme related to lactoylglutathione lyase